MQEALLFWSRKSINLKKIPGLARSSFWLQYYENKEIRAAKVLTWNKDGKILILVDGEA
jgi:hypothetical protein